VKLILLGLGNPGKKYLLTRHNIGHLFLDHYANLNSSKFEKKADFLVSQFIYSRVNIFLLKSTLFMNQNGIGLSNFLKIMNPACDEFLIVHDEINLPRGKVKLTSGKSAGGHNGVKSVLDEIGYSPIRMRIGIDSPSSPSVSLSDYVLEKFTPSETSENISLFPKLVHGIHLLCDRGLSFASNYINRYPIPCPF
jgi:PTH1 family peptidyl-tRNA hydrolase